MAFSILFTNDALCYPYDDGKTAAATGLLVLGSVKQSFLASLYQWSQREYEMQWKHAIKVLLDKGNKAALIATYGSPEVATHLEWWPMYVVDDAVYFQNHLLFYNQLHKQFSLETAFSLLPNRRTIDEEGKTISEWKVSISEIEAFAATF